MKKTSMFEKMLMAFQNTADATFRWQYQKKMMKDTLLSQRAYNDLVRDTAREVLSNISATVDASEIFDAIDGIEKRLNELGK